MGLFRGPEKRDLRERGRPVEVHDERSLDAAIGEGPAVVYKHSTRCGISLVARREIAAFAAGHPEVPVVQIDVLASRGLSNRVAERLGVRHQSPQAILVYGGEAVWDASHFRVRATSLAEALERACGGGTPG